MPKRSRIAVVTFAGRGLDHVTGKHQGWFIIKRIDESRIGVWHQDHVRSFNTFPAGNRGTIKRVSLGKFVFTESLDRHGYMLLFALGIGKTEINKFDFVFFGHF